jgi:hypothetical protein
MLIDVSMRSLKSRLVQDAHLVGAVARLWGVDPARQDGAATVSLLTQRMQDAFWARGVWESLEPGERICLFQALTGDERGKGIACERLRKRTKLAEPVFEMAIARLLASGLLEEGEVQQKPSVRRPELLQLVSERAVFVYRECAQSLCQTGQELFTAFHDRTSMSLDRLVGARSWEQLQDLAHLCRVPSRRLQQIRLPLELQRCVGEALMQPLVVFDMLHRVDMQAQQVFLWLCGNGGKAGMQDALAFAGGDNERLRDLLRSLEAHALAFDALTPAGDRVVFIQEALYAAAKGEAGQYAEDERVYAFFPVSSVPVMVREAQPHLCYDLAVAVGSVCQTRIEPTKDDTIPKRLVARIRPLLHGLPRIGEEQTDLYLDMLFRAAKGLELLQCATPYGEEKPCYQLGPKLLQWSQLTTEEQLRRFLAWWSKSTTWYDVRPDGGLLYPSNYNTHTVRRTLLSDLQCCVPGQWYPTEAFLYALWRQRPIVLSEGSYGQQTPGRRTSLRGRREQWMRQGEGLLYTALLSSTLHEAGMIALADTREAEGEERASPQLFQVTQLGAAALAAPGGAGEQEGAADQKVLIVQPNYDVLIMQPHWEVLYSLLYFAQIVHIGPVSTFKLTKSALLHGLEAGLSAEQVLTFLTRHCRQGDVPQNVAYTIREDWPKGYQVANLAEVILLELSSEQREGDLQQALLALGCEVRKLAPRLFAVTPNGHAFLAIKRALEKSGLVVKGQPSLSVRRW